MKDLPVCLLGHIYCNIKQHNMYCFNGLFLFKSLQTDEKHKKLKKKKLFDFVWKREKKNMLVEFAVEAS